MSMDPNIWVSTLPNKKKEHISEKYNLDYSKWVGTIPKKNITNSSKKYTVITIFFVIGLVFVSLIKNETRKLEKEINNLQAVTNKLKFDLHQSILDYNVITSPENISRLAKEHLEVAFISYKKYQLMKLSEKAINLSELDKNKNKKDFKEKKFNLPENIKTHVAKKIKDKKTELKKLQAIYSEPKKMPEKLKTQVARKIEETKDEIKQLVSDPRGSFEIKKIQKWAGIQLVKAFFGIPVIPGK